MKNDLSLRETTRHGTISFPFQLYPCTIPESYTFLTMHWHEEMEITLIQEGLCNYMIDLNSYQVEKGDLIILSPHMLHGVGQTADLTMVSDSFVFSLNMLGYSYPDSCTTKYLQPLANQKWQFPIVIRSADENAAELKTTFTNIKKYYLEQPYGFELELKASLFHFLGILFQCAPDCAENDRDNSAAAEKIKLVIEYIQKNYQQAISITELADICHFSNYHFMHFFKKHVAMTSIEYLNNYRLSMTLQQLKHSTVPITNIALENGFNNISYFNRLFKKQFGITPREYRLY